jgi:hypothetical protein
MLSRSGRVEENCIGVTWFHPHFYIPMKRLLYPELSISTRSIHWTFANIPLPIWRKRREHGHGPRLGKRTDSISFLHQWRGWVLLLTIPLVLDTSIKIPWLIETARLITAIFVQLRVNLYSKEAFRCLPASSNSIQNDHPAKYACKESSCDIPKDIMRQIDTSVPIHHRTLVIAASATTSRLSIVGRTSWTGF